MGWQDDIYDKLDDAEIFGGGEFIRDGSYLLTIMNMTLGKGEQGVSFRNEFIVDECKATDEKDETGAAVQPNPVGSMCSTVFNVTKHKGTAYSNQKKLVLAAIGSTQAKLAAKQDAENAKARSEDREAVNVFKKLLKRINNEGEGGQILRGVKIRATTYRQATRDMKANNAPRGEWHTYVKFAHVENSKEEIEANRVRMDEAKSKIEEAKARAEAAAAPTSDEGSDDFDGLDDLM